MTAPSEATIPAWRLRAGDTIPSYGPTATITRPPVISPDGSMVSALITGLTDPAPRLARLPVDQPVKVLRTREPATTFVRFSRTARSSGARILVLDLKHPHSEVEPVDGQPYATLCTNHHVLRFYTASSTAEAMCSHPEEWCPPCAKTAHDLAYARVHGTTPTTARRASA